MYWFRRNWHRVLVHLLSLAPLVLLLVGYWRDDLTAVPTRFATLRTGAVGLILLMASLACTPLNTLLGWSRAIQIRRALGVYGFLYVTLHIVVYAVLENALELELIWRDIWERRAMSAGLLGFLLLIPLALTSTQGWQRRLGVRWRKLHRLVYVATPLSVLHYYWLERDFADWAVFYAALVAALLLFRVQKVRQSVVRWRQRSNG